MHIFSRYAFYISLNIVVSLVILLIAIVLGKLICYTTSLSQPHFTCLIGMSHSACVFKLHVVTGNCIWFTLGQV